jgi:DNA-binding transcriptional ArsR family regulator
MDAPKPAPEPLEVLTIDRPEQIKALGHPLRLRVLELLGETGEELSNRELASRLEVDPGHLHFHVRMLVRAGLIQPVAGAGRAREKPYRAIAKAIRVAPGLLGTGSTDIHAAMLEEVQRGWEKYGPEGRFRSAQLTARLKPEHVRQLWQEYVDKAEELEDPNIDPVLITLVSHPYTEGE